MKKNDRGFWPWQTWQARRMNRNTKPSLMPCPNNCGANLLFEVEAVTLRALYYKPIGVCGNCGPES